MELRHTVIAMTSSHYWGKGKDVETALANCRKEGARGSCNVLVWIYTGPEDKLAEVTVNGVGDIYYPAECQGYRVGMFKLNVSSQPKPQA